jgi:hypothetical protein
LRASNGWLAGVVLLVLLVAGAATWWVRSTGAPSALTLTGLDGAVSVSHDGALEPGRTGRVLGPEDHVITGVDGTASLWLGGQTRITLGPASSVEITAIDATGVTLELEDGLVSATVRPDSGAVRVGNGGREVVATNAVFDVGVEGGVMGVAVAEGDVALSGADVTRVGAGQQVWVVDRHGEVGQIPEELLLAVEWPSDARTRQQQWTVEGTTTPAATVAIRGGEREVQVVADATGAFRAVVALAEGENRVVVESVDLLGRRKEVPGVLVRDSRGPTFEAGVEYRGP